MHLKGKEQVLEAVHNKAQCFKYRRLKTLTPPVRMSPIRPTTV